MSVPSAFATGNNNPPPTGAILDLGGTETATAAQSVNHGAATLESVDFTAALSSTDITFAFREDPAFISFGDVSLTDLTHPGGNLILNGNFSLGTVGTNSATDWTFVNVYGASASGTVETGACGGGLTTCWYDGSVQAYDAIDQFVATHIGDTYDLSFEYTDDGGLGTFSDLSTNGDTTDTGGTGIDILAYAQADIPPAGGGTVPEPSTLVTLGTGLLSLAGFARRRFARNS
jgi:hypothetical protein